MVQYFEDESEERVRSFNEELRAFFSTGACPCISYVDVYNMTEALGKHSSGSVMYQEAKTMTTDGVHWGAIVNMNKVQIILNHILGRPLRDTQCDDRILSRRGDRDPSL